VYAIAHASEAAALVSVTAIFERAGLTLHDYSEAMELVRRRARIVATSIPTGSAASQALADFSVSEIQTPLLKSQPPPR